jgi:dihydrofolate reductase
MGKLIITTTMTVDAVIEVGEWFVSGGGHDRAGREQFEDAAGMVMGRPTYEGLAAYWSPLEGEWADLINPMRKYVASRTASGPLEWNATLIEGDVVEGIAKLKEELDGDLFLIGCGELARHLAANGVIDEHRFWIHPTVQGAGTRPYQGDETIPLQLLEAKSFDSGVALLRYAQVHGR